jgi:hypothetical protein
VRPLATVEDREGNTVEEGGSALEKNLAFDSEDPVLK